MGSIPGSGAHSSIYAWQIPWTEEAGGLQSMGSQRGGDNSVTKPSPAPGFSSVAQFCLFATPGTAAQRASLSITNSRSLLKFMSIESVMPSNHLILCHPFLLPPSIFPSFRVFSNESVLHIRGPKDWNFSFSISPSNDYSRLISFRMDWLAWQMVRAEHGTSQKVSSLKLWCGQLLWAG